MNYKIYYRGEDANYPAFETEEDALNFYVKEVSATTGETREEILGEEWTSPRGVEKCVKIVEVEDAE